jgi:LPPG:FO 2-phospho-L-lactate transferase
VRRRCAPTILEVAYDGAARARAHPDVPAALRDPRLRAIVICPSNPFLSIEPILAIGALPQAARSRGRPPRSCRSRAASADAAAKAIA